MRVFPTHFNRRFGKIIEYITVFVGPYFRSYLGPYFPFVGSMRKPELGWGGVKGGWGGVVGGVGGVGGGGGGGGWWVDFSFFFFISPQGPIRMMRIS